MSPEAETRKLRHVLLAAVKGVMKAHLEDLKKQGVVFSGAIMDVSMNDNMTSLRFEFSDAFKKFIVSQIETGDFQNGLESKTVIILDSSEL